MERFNVLVCGSPRYDQAEKVRYALNRLAWTQGDIRVIHLGGEGAAAGARWYASARGWPVEQSFGPVVFKDERIDYVLRFGDDASGVVEEARSRSITVGEVA